MTAPHALIDPLFDDGGAAMVALARAFGPYRTYAEHERIEVDVGRGLPQRYDSVAHFVRSGGRLGRDEEPRALTARTSYLREEYAYGDHVFAPGIEPFLHHEALVAGARAVHGRPVVEPVIAYANVMLPGQELAVHTDVPEFRGLNRKVVPQWLLVVMHHSGLFDRWRLPIATGIAWFGHTGGGALAWWPDGPAAPGRVHEAGDNTALVLDTDTVFHGVDPVGGPDVVPPPVTVGSSLSRVDAAGQTWALADPDGAEVARYAWDDLRLSVSWKAYCFTDEAERTAWREHTDDLTYEAVVDALVADLHRRGAITADAARDTALGRTMIDEYIRFPAS